MGAVMGHESEVRGQNVQCVVSRMAHRDVLEPHRAVSRADLKNTVQDSVSVTSKIRVYDGVPALRTLEVVR